MKIMIQRNPSIYIMMDLCFSAPTPPHMSTQTYAEPYQARTAIKYDTPQLTRPVEGFGLSVPDINFSVYYNLAGLIIQWCHHTTLC